MAEDWLADIRRYVPQPDEEAVAGIVRHCGIALQSRDASLVSFGDPAETDRVRERFLKHKLGLTEPDEVLDGEIAAIGQRMSDTHFRNRVTVYYLLAERFGKLGLFHSASHEVDAIEAVAPVVPPVPVPPPAPEPVPLAAEVPPVAPASVTPVPPVTPAAAYVREPVAAPPPRKGLLGRWWLWLLVLLALLLLYLLLRSCSAPPPADTTASPPPAETAANTPPPAPPAEAPPAPADQAAPAPAPASAPADTTAAVPAGASVVASTRDGKPALTVYFDTAKAEVAPEFADKAADLKAYLAAHPDAKLTVSGFNDPTGNAALNAELSKRRAQAVGQALTGLGVADSAIDLAKPDDTVGAQGDNAAARRVEVTVK